MYSFGVSGWYGVGMSNWSVYKRMSICYWGMSVSMSIRKSSISYYWCLYFDWFWSFNLDGLYGWEGISQGWEGVVSIYSWSGNGNSSLTNRIDESILVNIFRETFEVKWAGTTWGGYKISPRWIRRSYWSSCSCRCRTSCICSPRPPSFDLCPPNRKGRRSQSSRTSRSKGTSSNLCWTSLCSCLRSCPSTCICPLSCTHSSYSYLHRTNNTHRNCTCRYPCCYQRPSPCLWRWILRRIPWWTPSCSCCQTR